LIFAAIVAATCLHADDDVGFKVVRQYEKSVAVDAPAVYTDHGIRLEAKPIFVRGARTTAEAISGFDCSISYRDPATNESERWLSHEFVGNRPGTEERLGPFINHRGTGFIIEVHVHSTATEAKLEFRLASDGIIEKSVATHATTAKGFVLLYDTIPLQGVRALKKVYTLYSNVTLAIDLVKLAASAVAFEEFAVGIVVSEAVGQVIALIPSEYRGVVGYRCRRCGHRGTLTNFLGCIELTCDHCKKNSSTICFKTVNLDISFAS
jgi:hypothetical protein